MQYNTLFKHKFIFFFLDICVDVSQIEPSQAHEMNLVAQKYGLLGADYFSFLTQDFEEAETLRQARKQEEEKAMYSVKYFIILCFIKYL